LRTRLYGGGSPRWAPACSFPACVTSMQRWIYPAGAGPGHRGV